MPPFSENSGNNGSNRGGDAPRKDERPLPSEADDKLFELPEHTTADDIPAPDPEKVDMLPSGTPIFGTYCRTLAFRHVNLQNFYEYYEAFQSDEADGTWDVALVRVKKSNVQVGEDGEPEERIASRPVVKGVSFAEALTRLAAFEQTFLDPSQQNIVVGPSREDMDTDHFIKFAEREGYIFDVVHVPHARVSMKALPPGATFRKTDLDRANERWKEAVTRYDGAPTPLPANGILSDMFRRAASKANIEDALTQSQALFQMDQFFDRLKNARALLSSYIDEYRELGKGGYLANAMKALDEAEGDLKKIDKLGVPTGEFKQFVEQFRICCLITHAQGMFNLNQERLFDATRPESAEEQFKENQQFVRMKTQEAVDRYRKMGATSKEIQFLQATVIQGTDPIVPDSIDTFIENYETRREAFTKKMSNGRPTPPKGNMPPAP